MSLTKPIPLKTRLIISEDPYYRTCARKNSECSGRITIEHAITYAGRRISDLWGLIPLCWYHHLGEGLNKAINRRLAFARATARDLQKYPRLKIM